MNYKKVKNTVYLLAGIVVMAFVHQASGEQYYWGDMHGHTNMSDGNGSVFDYFRYCRDSSQLDFAAVTDHDYLTRYFNLDSFEWSEVQQVARAFNQDGRFVAFPGWEWSWVYFHVPVYCLTDTQTLHSVHNIETDDVRELLGALKKGTYLCHMAHPYISLSQSWNFENDLMRNIEITGWNGYRFEYYGNFWGPPDSITVPGSYVQDALKTGFRFGLMGVGDAHDGRPGKRGLTAIIADTLTRETIMQALWQRRCYATTGPRVRLSFTIDGHNMGEEINITADPILAISFTSPMPVTSLEIIKNNRVAYVKIYTTATTDSISWADTTFEYPSCYYVRIRTLYSNGMVWSSPIWVSGTITGQPAPFDLVSPENGIKNTSLLPVLWWQAASDSLNFGCRVKYHVYLSSDRSSLGSPLDSTYDTHYQLKSNLRRNTTYYWMVEAVNPFNKRVSSPVYAFSTSNEPLSGIYPNPSNNYVNIPVSTSEAGLFDLIVYNVAGQRVATIVKSKQGWPGSFFNVRWDCTNDIGKRVAPGVYFLRLKTTSGVYSRSVTVLR